MSDIAIETRVHELIRPCDGGERFMVVVPGGTRLRYFDDYHHAYAYALAIRDYADVGVVLEDGAGAEHSERGEGGWDLAARSPSIERASRAIDQAITKATRQLVDECNRAFEGLLLADHSDNG